jgi:hypothetical protein
MASISSFLTRSFVFPDYNSPLFVTAMDAGGSDLPLHRIFAVPKRHVLRQEKWLAIAHQAEAILKDDKLWSERATQNPFRVREFRSSWKSYRSKTIQLLKRIDHDSTRLAYLAASNLVYVGSEGMNVSHGYDISTASLDWFYDTLTDLLVRRGLQEKLPRDDIFMWIRLVRIVSVNQSPEFKEAFGPVLHFHIPFGLSPETDSDTLE